MPKTSLPVKPAAVLGVLRELRASAKRDEPLVVSMHLGGWPAATELVALSAFVVLYILFATKEERFGA